MCVKGEFDLLQTKKIHASQRIKQKKSTYKKLTSFNKL